MGETMSINLDSLDVRILEVVQNDAMVPLAELAERTGSSKSVCWRRLQRLLDEGVIQERVAVLNPQKLGLEVVVFTHVKMSRHSRDVLPRFVEAIRRCPQVVECHTLMGNWDFLLKIVVRDVAEYEHFFWHQLSQMEGVREVSSSIAMTRFVDRTQLPLMHLQSGPQRQAPGPDNRRSGTNGR